MAKLIVLQGIPASGKSTYVRKWQAAKPEQRVIVSRDSLRHARGEYWIRSQEDYITKLECFAVRQALKFGYDVAIDATNFNEPYLHRWELIAEENYAEYIQLLFHADLDECIRRNQNPERNVRVPNETIEYFYKKYEDFIYINIEPGKIICSKRLKFQK